VRRRNGDGFGIFRPTHIQNCKVSGHLEYRFEDYKLTSVLTLEEQKVQI